MIGKYDKEYYILQEYGDSVEVMLAERSDSGTLSSNGNELMYMPYAIQDRIIGVGKLEITDGDEDEFEPCDIHLLPNMLISKKALKLFKEFSLPEVDFYEAEIITKNKTWEDLYLVHLYHEINAIHPKRSVYDGEVEDMDVMLESLSLNEEVLDKIELHERLVFQLEGCARFVVHESIVKAIEDTKLTGIEAIRVDKWNIGSMFD